MDCSRCHGLMIEERFEDLRGDPHHVSFCGWRCVTCGNITDPLIIKHRSHRPAPVVPVFSAVAYSFPEFGIEAPAA